MEVTKKLRTPFVGTFTESGSPIVFWTAATSYLGAALIAIGAMLSSLRPPARKTRIPLSDQIEHLHRAGILATPDIVQRLQDLNPVDDYETDPYLSIFHAVSEMNESADGANTIPANFFYFDSECIDGTGDYVMLATRMASISGGTIRVDGLVDEFDRTRKRAVLKGGINGRPFRWEFPLEDDYVADKFFVEFNEVLAATKSQKRFMGLYLGGQDLFIFCVTPEQRIGLKTETGKELGEL